MSFSALAVRVGIQLLGTDSFKILSALKVVVALLLLLKLGQASKTSMTTNSGLMWRPESSSTATTSLPDVATSVFFALAASRSFQEGDVHGEATRRAQVTAVATPRSTAHTSAMGQGRCCRTPSSG